MADKKLYIEIGERLVKVCAGIGRRNLAPALSFTFQTPAGTVTDGQLDDPGKLAEALKDECAKRNVRGKSVTFTLSSGKVAAREVTLPPVKESRLKALVESNAPDYFPVDMSKYHISYTILDYEPKGDNAGYRVLVLAAPLSILEGYFKLADAAGLQVDAIDYIGNSQYRALENRCGSEITMCINVDTNTTNVSFMKEKRLMLQRVLPIGADELIQNFMTAAGIPDGKYAEALQVLSAGEKEKIFAVLPEPDVKESLSRLVNNIVRTAEYFNSSNWETPVEKLVLFGGCSNVVGLLEELKEVTSVPTVYLNDLPGYKDVPEKAAAELSGYLCCAGSSLQPVDFIPAQFAKKKSKASKQTESVKPAVAFVAVCVVVGVLISLFAMSNYKSALSQKVQLEKEISDLQYAKITYLTYMDYQNGVLNLENLSGSTDSSCDDLNSFISEMEKKMPSEIRVLSAACSTQSVDMNVTVGTKEEAAKVIEQFRTFESIGSVTVGPIAATTDESGATVVAFSISCVYASAMEETTAATTATTADTTNVTDEAAAG